MCSVVSVPTLRSLHCESVVRLSDVAHPWCSIVSTVEAIASGASMMEWKASYTHGSTLPLTCSLRSLLPALSCSLSFTDDNVVLSEIK